MSTNRLHTGASVPHEDGEILALLDFLRQQSPEERISMLRGEAVPRGNGHALAPADPVTLRQTVYSALMSLPWPALGDLVLMLTIWMGLEPRRKALLLKTLVPELTDGMVAAACNVNRSSLYRWPEYVRLKAFQKHPSSVMRGEQDEDGNIEAWFDAAG